MRSALSVVLAIIAVALLVTLSLREICDNLRLATRLLLPPPPASGQPTPAARARIQASYANLPLAFEQNQGQTDAQVKYLARGSGYTLFLTANDAVFSLHSRRAETEARQLTKCSNRRARGTAERSSRLLRRGTHATCRRAIRWRKIEASDHVAGTSATTSSAMIPAGGAPMFRTTPGFPTKLFTPA